MKIIGEFRKFVARGNVIDLAVGIIMGAAFTKIVNSLVNDIVMPPIGYVLGGIDFKELKFTLPPIKVSVPDPTHVGEFVEKALGPVSINWGNFIQVSIEFLIVAFAVFMLVKLVNSLRRNEEVAPAEAPPQEKLLAEIRDLLKERKTSP